MKILNSKFNQIFMNSGFNIADKLKSLQEKLTKSNKHSVVDIAKETKDVH